MTLTREQQFWLQHGIRWDHVNATFENFDVTNEDALAAVKAMESFIYDDVGTFAILSGEYGTGKSHLAAAALKAYGGGLFATNSEILSNYRSLPFQNHKAMDKSEFVSKLRKLCFLVIDELGTSMGGTDENSLFDEVISYRADRQLPTVFTSNSGLDKVEQFLGGRLMDRVRQSVVIVPTVKGSRRNPTGAKRVEGIPHYEMTFEFPRVRDYFDPIGWGEYVEECWKEPWKGPRQIGWNPCDEVKEEISHPKYYCHRTYEFEEWLKGKGRRLEWPINLPPTPQPIKRVGAYDL